MSLSITVPMVTGAASPGPALGHTKITCISIVTTLQPQWTCEGGISSFPPCRELGLAGRSSDPGAADRTCHELLHPVGTAGLIFGNWPSTSATKQVSAEVSLLAGHWVRAHCRPPLSCFTCHQLSWKRHGLGVLAWAGTHLT